ncbi:hypothetical protein PAESOLCIP111_06714 [Paenibacillus solanacearum]|uniref:Nucleotidyltransferase n=1 Tax=Paenibacillus solanacearum TaxID=2048548 RepID=A0A916K9L4_9BACL|nr:CBASS oligonucleotide cyclase [Paenibacillus solanacearum]CAG7653161.1 hypothetical protein PAESOLCIP111_06714 [Paenibacillus solanacearum]
MLFSNSDLQNFADGYVNLKKEKVKKYREQVNRLRDNLEEYIKESTEYGLVKMLHSGSVAKGTALSTINDMDVAVYVKSNEVEGSDEKEILEYIRSALFQVYKRHGMTEDQFTIGTHCVKVQFKGSGLDVDVVPVIYEGDEDDRGYLISNGTGERLLTSISLHKQFIRDRKAAYGNYAQMVRIIKWWRLKREFKMKSFLIELVWAHIADTEGINTDIFAALKQFFKYIVDTELLEPIIFTDNYKKSEVTISAGVPNVLDPVNSANNVASSLDFAKRTRIVDEADEALAYLINAGQASTKEKATQCLKEIFGSSFSY